MPQNKICFPKNFGRQKYAFTIRGINFKSVTIQVQQRISTLIRIWGTNLFIKLTSKEKEIIDIKSCVSIYKTKVNPLNISFNITLLSFKAFGMSLSPNYY